MGNRIELNKIFVQNNTVQYTYHVEGDWKNLRVSVASLKRRYVERAQRHIRLYRHQKFGEQNLLGIIGHLAPERTLYFRRVRNDFQIGRASCRERV